MSRGEKAPLIGRGTGSFFSGSSSSSDTPSGMFSADPSAVKGRSEPLLREITNLLENFRAESSSLHKNSKLIGKDRDSYGVRRKMKVQRQRITDLNKEIASLFSQLAHIEGASVSLGARKLRQQWKEGFDQFKKFSTKTLQREREHPIKHLESEEGGVETGKGSLRGMMPGDESKGGASSGIVPGKLQEMTFEDDMTLETDILRERTEAIKDIEDEMRDLNEAFRDISDMIEDQREGVETIADNVTTAADATDQAIDDLTQAEVYQKKARKKRCIILVVVCVIAAICLAGVGLGFGLKKKR